MILLTSAEAFKTNEWLYCNQGNVEKLPEEILSLPISNNIHNRKLDMKRFLSSLRGTATDNVSNVLGFDKK